MTQDPRWDEGKRREAAALYNDGLPVRGVAVEMGVSTRRAWEYLQEAQAMGLCKMRPEGRPKKVSDGVVE